MVLAAAIGRSRSQLAVFDLTGAELGSSSVDHEIGAGPDEVMGPMVHHLDTLLAGLGTRRRSSASASASPAPSTPCGA